MSKRPLKLAQGITRDLEMLLGKNALPDSILDNLQEIRDNIERDNTLNDTVKWQVDNLIRQAQIIGAKNKMMPADKCKKIALSLKLARVGMLKNEDPAKVLRDQAA